MENGTEDARSARIDATLGSAERKSNGAERGVWAARTRHDEVAREPGYLRRPGRELAAPAIGRRRHGRVVTRRHRARASSASVAPVTRPLSRWASGEINKSRFLRAPVAWSGLVGRSARALFACASCGVQSTKTRRHRRAGRCTRGWCAAMPVPRRTKNLTLSPHLFVTSKLVKPKNGKCGKMEIVFIIDSPH